MNDKQETKISIKIWKNLFPYLKRLRKHIFIVMACMMVSSLSEASFPLFTQYAVNNFVTQGTTRGILPFAITFAVVILLGGVAVVFYSRGSMVVEMQMGRMLKRDCFVHLQRLPLSFYNTNSVGYLLARVMSDTDKISSIVSWGFIHMAWNIAYVVFALVIMFTLNVRLALILLAVIPVVGAITWFFETKILVVNRHVRNVNSLITGAFNEGITGAKTSKTLVIEDVNCRDFGKLTEDMYSKSLRSATLNALMMPLVLFCGSVAVAAVLYRGGILVMDDIMDYGIISAFISYAVSIINPVVDIAGVLTDIISAQVGIERVTSLLNEPCTVRDTPEVEAKYGDVFSPKRENWEPIKGNVTFEHVWFKYPDGEDYVLEDFCLDVKSGSTVAIVGETGAGKSTLVNLVCRFFEPTRGRILIDGRDSRERSLLWLHSSIGYVLQDPHLFSGTIAENISYGKSGASMEEIESAARLVSADCVAERMPEGYDTQVGEGGDRLSTGEKQLISFARAVIANPPIFVLDEATSSIDTETEKLIQNAITKVLSGRTSFIIAHRLSTIRSADLILVVDKGKITEMGTHDELMSLGGRYSSLYEAMSVEQG